MEVGPITGVRALSLLNSSRAVSALDPVFKIDPTGRADDETYSPGRKAADRGLEEETTDSEDCGEDELFGASLLRPASSRISYFV
jgi:hypothetical protein